MEKLTEERKGQIAHSVLMVEMFPRRAFRFMREPDRHDLAQLAEISEVPLPELEEYFMEMIEEWTERSPALRNLKL